MLNYYQMFYIYVVMNWL